MTKEKFSTTSYETVIVNNNTSDRYIKITKARGKSTCTVEHCYGRDELVGLFEMNQKQAVFIAKFILQASKNKKPKAQVKNNKSENIIAIYKDEFLDSYFVLVYDFVSIKAFDSLKTNDPDNVLELENKQAKLFAESLLKLYKPAVKK